MKVIIAGGRNFRNYDLLQKKCDVLLRNQKNIEIVSGGAKGADYWGECYAEDNNLRLKIFKADWDKYGKSAGYRRNVQMAEYADALIAFWDGKSKGTGHMINIAKEHNLKVRVVRYE